MDSKNHNLDDKYLAAVCCYNNGELKMSQMTKSILGLDNINETKIKDIESFNDRIINVLCGLGFSSRRFGYDEFVKDSYNDDYINESSIKGSGNYYIYPRGQVCFHNSNKLFYDVANIIFMIQENFIPTYLLESETIDFTKLIKIPRKSGSIQDGRIGINTALKISKTLGGVWSFVTFLDNGHSYEKHVKLSELIDTNLIDTFRFNIPKLNKEDYNFENYEYLSNELIDEIIEYYNNKIVTFMKKFISINMNEYNVTNEIGWFCFTKK